MNELLSALQKKRYKISDVNYRLKDLTRNDKDKLKGLGLIPDSEEQIGAISLSDLESEEFYKTVLVAEDGSPLKDYKEIPESVDLDIIKDFLLYRALLMPCFQNELNQSIESILNFTTDIKD